MQNEQKTYSGIQAYHEMLMRAQAYCPALLYVMCKLLLDADTKTKKDPNRPRSRVVHHGGRDSTDPLRFYFNKDGRYSRMNIFCDKIFDSQTVSECTMDDYGYAKGLSADLQFVLWLKENRVTIDESKMLVTIHC